MLMATNWAERVSAFSRSPSRFVSGTSSEAFLAELLRELRDDRASYSIKVLLLSPLCEYPTVLCPSDSVAEETALELMSVFAQCPPKFAEFRCHLLLAVTSVLICTSCVSSCSHASQDFLDLLLEISQDINDIHGDGTLHSLRATVCDCLRELEACCPGLLSQRLELLGGLRQQETSGLHQAYAGLHTLVLRNAVYQLTQETGAGAEHLKALLGGNTLVAWEADQDSGVMSNKDAAILSSLILGPMGTLPTLQTGTDCKELRSVLSSLLEESYLLTPLCQAALLHRLTEVVAMVPGVPPALLRAQLLRLLGTSEVCLLHATLLMKCAFTDSLFSAEDEAFILKRLVVLSQHPLLNTPEKLFYMDCILHFPENRPISGGDETLPVLLTPQLASALVPTVFNDSATMLARLNLLSLVYLEEVEEVEGEEVRGLAYLYEHLTSLQHIVENGGSREIVVTFFRSAFLFLYYLCHVERYSRSLVEKLCELYLHHTNLAPHLINLADRTQDRLSESDWAVGLLRSLQRVITEAPLAQLTLQDLHWHLKVLARVADEGEIPQQSTLGFLSGIITPSSSSLCVSGDWRLGNNMLAVCRRLLVHPSLDSLLIPLADILQHLSCHYGDTDIQDHARLYYTLLTTLSREKLARVLAQGAIEGGRQVEKPSCIMAESERLTRMLTIHQTDKAIFKLVNVNSQAQTNQENNLNPNRTETCPDEANTAVEAYTAQFQNPDFASEITLMFQLTHSGTHDSLFDELFSIRLHFTLTDDHYEELSDISVPCLFRERPSPILNLSLKPRRPYPTTLHASAIFTTQDGLSWHTILPDIHVNFQQVFLPLPTPQAWGQGSKLCLFEGLWNKISSDSGENNLAECATSLFCCQLKEEALVALVDKHFLPYLISELSTKDDLKVLFFLPPQSHVLLTIRSEEDAVHFNIATDNWQLLSHISPYLLTITSSQEDTHS
ncbi:AP-5 complex subunit beta-1 [Mastacembelus armatus]|uniref:AP-5 complex subunit beta-1 n=1 Tax=Mastacembelus armatus TaxID=205130 RepID=A0A3Q3NER5_9TELE|nr:AP-5 complex subunit beta-1 [Mastacembelus armatus]XP_026163306.1 AP-5 complex subunit beta-1 [Mastacembelus armatus]